MKLNGAELGDSRGFDSRPAGEGEVREPRMYQLIRQRAGVKDATFEIEFLDSRCRGFFTYLRLAPAVRCPEISTTRRSSPDQVFRQEQPASAWLFDRDSAVRFPALQAWRTSQMRVRVLYKRAEIPANKVIPALAVSATYRRQEKAANTDAILSYTSPGSQVPFYFQPTLGGKDIDGTDSLRGYGDYRFRGPDRLFAQLDYRHPVWAPVGLVGFYDVGKVALDRADLSLDHTHHDVGVGLFFQIGGREVARVFVGFGTREPTHLHPSFGNILQ